MAPADSVLQLETFAGVVETPGVLTGDRQARSVFRFEGRDVLDHPPCDRPAPVRQRRR